MQYLIQKEEIYNKDMKNVVKKCLGKTYANNIISEKKTDSILLSAYVNDEIVGFASGYNDDTFDDYINIYDQKLEANSLLEKIAVLPEYRGYGIGTSLTKYIIRQLKQPTIAELWLKSNTKDISALYEKLGFNRVMKCENRWLNESKKVEDQNFCPICGSICKCDSAIYKYK